MAGLPQLNQDDVTTLDAALDALLQRSDATTALVIDKGGPLISQRGAVDKFDTTTISALASGAFSATEAIALRMGENQLAHIYQQGGQLSLLISNVDENLLVITIFPANLSVGAVKYYASDAVARIAAQMQKAAQREPGAALDLVSMNVLDVSGVFRKSG
jgi:predicted regulator of Ras-like GTPase activity (Roadblock/LC7/MglB family)